MSRGILPQRQNWIPLHIAPGRPPAARAYSSLYALKLEATGLLLDCKKALRARACPIAEKPIISWRMILPEKAQASRFCLALVILIISKLPVRALAFQCITAQTTSHGMRSACLWAFSAAPQTCKSDLQGMAGAGAALTGLI